MDDALLRQLRQDLETDRADAAENLAALGSNKGDPLTEMLAAGLRDIDDALRKMSSGRYGTCETCRKPIPDARLRALPSVRLCLHCESVAT